jgi:hypothetical protein
LHQVLEQPGEGKGRDGRLNEDMSVRRQGFEKLSHAKIVEVEGLNPLVFGISCR